MEKFFRIIQLRVDPRWHRPSPLGAAINPGNKARRSHSGALKGGRRKGSWLGSPGLKEQDAPHPAEEGDPDPSPVPEGSRGGLTPPLDGQRPL